MEIYEYSNPELAQKKAIKYLGKDAKLYLSSKKGKKYDIFDPINQKVVSFGQLGFQDHTKHQDEIRRQRYLARATKMRGNWKDNKYSANNLSINILW